MSLLHSSSPALKFTCYRPQNEMMLSISLSVLFSSVSPEGKVTFGGCPICAVHGGLVKNRMVFIARHHPYMRAERHTVTWQIRPSLRNTLVLYRNRCTYRQTISTLWYGHDFERYRHYKIPRAIPQWGVKHIGR